MRTPWCSISGPDTWAPLWTGGPAHLLRPDPDSPLPGRHRARCGDDGRIRGRETPERPRGACCPQCVRLTALDVPGQGDLFGGTP